MSTTLVPDLAGPPTPRTCGRCRVAFPGDADEPQGRDTGWWACATCRGHLFGPGALPARWRAPAAEPTVRP